VYGVGPHIQRRPRRLKETPGRQHNGQTGHTPVVCCVVCDRNIATSRAGLCCPRTDVCCSSTPHGKRRDFFSTHFDINYLPENQARTEALWESSENGGRAAYDGERRVTFVARFCWSRREVCFQEGERVEIRTLLCRGVEGQILSVSDMGIFQ